MNWIRKPLLLIRFIIYYLKELVISNLKIAGDVLRPGMHIQPGFINVPLKTQTDFEILALANLVTMTPGTLSVDVSEDQKTLIVHTLYLQDPEAVRKEISENLQGRILELLR
jgi:multicomponent Na+:H+ antiporter subunit E